MLHIETALNPGKSDINGDKVADIEIDVAGIKALDAGDFVL